MSQCWYVVLHGGINIVDRSRVMWAVSHFKNVLYKSLQTNVQYIHWIVNWKDLHAVVFSSPLPPGRSAFRRWQPEESFGEGEAGSFPHASLHPSRLSEPSARYDWSGRRQEAHGKLHSSPHLITLPSLATGRKRAKIFHQQTCARFAFVQSGLLPEGLLRLNLAEMHHDWPAAPALCSRSFHLRPRICLGLE